MVNSAPQAWRNSSGQNLAQAQYNASLNGNLAQQVGAARAGMGHPGGMSALYGSQQQGGGMTLAALGQAGQTQGQQLAGLTGLQNQLYNQYGKGAVDLQNLNQQAAYEQAGLTQQQHGINQGEANQFSQMGQNAQLADLSARAQLEGYALQQSEANAKQNSDLWSGIGNAIVHYGVAAAA
jgi:hypothetical protein